MERMSYSQHKLYENNQKTMYHSGMIHSSLILHHNMGMKCAEDPFNMGVFFLPKASFMLGTFSDPQHTYLGIFILESPPGQQVKAASESRSVYKYTAVLIRLKG